MLVDVDVRNLGVGSSGSWEFAGAISKAAGPLRALTPDSGAYQNEVSKNSNPQSFSSLRTRGFLHRMMLERRTFMSQITASHSGAKRIMLALQPLRSKWTPAMSCRCGMVSVSKSTLLFGIAIRYSEISALMYVLCLLVEWECDFLRVCSESETENLMNAVNVSCTFIVIYLTFPSRQAETNVLTHYKPATTLKVSFWVTARPSYSMDTRAATSQSLRG